MYGYIPKSLINNYSKGFLTDKDNFPHNSNLLFKDSKTKIDQKFISYII